MPADYRQNFTSFDGRNRSFVVEGVGGPSWFTEYNVLTGLSVRSYGRFADFVTRIAAGRVERGLPWALRRCGYKTYSFYSYLGAFLNARGFQETAGIENFYDAKKMDAHGVEPDSFFYDAAARVVEQEKGKQEKEEIQRQSLDDGVTAGRGHCRGAVVSCPWPASPRFASRGFCFGNRN